MRDTRCETGSALILAVVLTSMLAIVGVTFLMVARVNRTATSAISENKELNFAVETVIAKISQELVLDVPGAADPNQEYYDYPDSANRWLASLEPYEFGGNYYWQQISNLTETGGAWRNLQAEIIPDYQNSVNDSLVADADGDGVADSVWIPVADMNSSKGKPIFAAIRIVDNGAMLNVNTAYKFDPNDPTVTADDIDGSSQTQINLLALSERGSTSNPLGKLDNERFGYEPLPHILNDYIRDVVLRYNEPNGLYTPFDISDELELRYRFLVNQGDIDTRIEEVWDNVFQVGKRTPFDSNIPGWFDRAQFDVSEPNKYSYRHIGTTYNMDRITNPSGGKMANVNTDGEALLYAAIRAGLYDANVPDPNSFAAQMAVNIVDYRDEDSDVTAYNGYYGFERPCIYISELDHNSVTIGDPPVTYRSYAIELYKPYSEDIDPNASWQLVISDGNSIPIPIDSWTGGKQFYVIRNEDPCAPLPPVDSNAVIQDSNALVFNSNSNIFLQRFVADVNDYIVVDSVLVPAWLLTGAGIRSHQRDITLHKCIRRLWDDFATKADSPTLGYTNSYIDPDPQMIQAHPANARFTNIGEIGIVFRKSAYPESGDVIGPSDTEATARIDLAHQNFQQIFNYITVFDPTVDGIDNNGDGYGIAPNVDPNELKIPGRININTAPWYVIAQLPWMRPEIAQAIVAYRDKTSVPAGDPNYVSRPGEPGFASIGELNNVVIGGPDYRMDYYALDPNDLQDFPDLTPDDEAVNDFEERDVIFARISNLVTVRSDVFTVYILVRIGADGPQKRVIAILDRSNAYSRDDKVRIVALHPVPDPR